MSARKATLKKRAAFLEHLAKHGNISAAARSVGVDRRFWYRVKETDQEFAGAWDDAVEQAVDLMLEEARRRALKGIEEPVFYQGNVCGHIQRYSDVLLMFLVKAHRPEYATERRKVDMNTDGLKELADVLRAGPVPRAV